MAKLSVSGLDDLMLSLQEVAEIPDAVQDEMLNAGADILIPEIKARGEGYGVEDTGLTLKSLAKSKVKKNQKIGRYLTVYFKGSRVRGKDPKTGKNLRIKNSEIAFLNEYGNRMSEYGTQKHPARPFFGDALKLSEKTIAKAQEAIYDKWLKSKKL